MMNARERRGLEELRAYYNKVQKAVEAMQEKARKAEDMGKSAENHSVEQHMAVAYFVAYKECIQMILAE